MTIGIVRALDELGRVTLPKETRDFLGFNNRQQVSIHVEDDCIIIKPVFSKSEVIARLRHKYTDEEIDAIVTQLELN